MAATRTASAHWEGSLLEGEGSVNLSSSGLGELGVSWPSRIETPDGRTSPEELIGAAHSACFLMVLTNLLSKAGHVPRSLDASADVTFQPGTGITGIVLHVTGMVPDVSAEEFTSAAEEAKATCPVSKALSGVKIELETKFQG